MPYRIRRSHWKKIHFCLKIEQKKIHLLKWYFSCLWEEPPLPLPILFAGRSCSSRSTFSSQARLSMPVCNSNLFFFFKLRKIFAKFLHFPPLTSGPFDSSASASILAANADLEANLRAICNCVPSKFGKIRTFQPNLSLQLRGCRRDELCVIDETVFGSVLLHLQRPEQGLLGTEQLHGRGRRLGEGDERARVRDETSPDELTEQDGQIRRQCSHAVLQIVEQLGSENRLFVCLFFFIRENTILVLPYILKLWRTNEEIYAYLVRKSKITCTAWAPTPDRRARECGADRCRRYQCPSRSQPLPSLSTRVPRAESPTGPCSPRSVSCRFLSRSGNFASKNSWIFIRLGAFPTQLQWEIFSISKK